MRRAPLVAAGAALVLAAVAAGQGGAVGATAGSPNSLPKGDLPGWHQVYAENFNAAVKAPVPVGKFTGCNHNADTPAAYCSGLPAGHWRDTLWAYPSGWDDTARSGADGNDGAPYGGTYEPQRTVSVGKGYDGGGTLRVHMSAGPTAGSPNVVGTVVPRKCMDLADGRYSARVKVTKADDGFKSAWLRYEGARAEVDFPEVDGYKSSNVAAFVHPGGNNIQTSARMTTAHTYTWERRGGTVTFYLDNVKLRSFPTRLTTSSWIWQNESRIESGDYADPGDSATLETTWATCYTAK
jgi:hypothetical protein